MEIILFNKLKSNIFFIIFYVKITLINLRLSFINPTSLYLLNGNIFIIHKYGIDICNNYLTKIIKTPIVFPLEE